MTGILSRIGEALLAFSVAVMLTIAFVPELALANPEREAKPQRAAPMQVTAAKSKKMPNVTMENICDPKKRKTSRQGNMLKIMCTPSSPAASSVLTATPGVQRSEINCKYTENDQGGLDVESCTCKADSDSNCTNFITWCAKSDGNVGGNNQNATCD